MLSGFEKVDLLHMRHAAWFGKVRAVHLMHSVLILRREQVHGAMSSGFGNVGSEHEGSSFWL